MAIQKRFIHFKKFSDFNSKKLSANEANTQYTVGVSGAIQDGEPDILYQSYVWIKDTKQQWTHGQLYDGSVSQAQLNHTIDELWRDKQDKIADLDEIRSGALKGANVMLQIDYDLLEDNLVDSGFFHTLDGMIHRDNLDDSVLISLNKADSALLEHQDISGKQDKLVSGTNIKTINGESILGSGDIVISGGGSSDTSDCVKVVLGARPHMPNADGEVDLSADFTRQININGDIYLPDSRGIVDLGYVNKQLSTSTSTSMALSPNIYYRNTSTSLSTLTITLTIILGSGTPNNNDIINEYFVEFTTSSSGTTVSLPSTIKWANGEVPTFEASTTYQISIVNNLGVVTKFK